MDHRYLSKFGVIASHRFRERPAGIKMTNAPLSCHSHRSPTLTPWFRILSRNFLVSLWRDSKCATVTVQQTVAGATAKQTGSAPRYVNQPGIEIQEPLSATAGFSICRLTGRTSFQPKLSSDSFIKTVHIRCGCSYKCLEGCTWTTNLPGGVFESIC